MSNYILTDAQVSAGRWQGKVKARSSEVARAPILEAWHDQTVVDNVTTTPIDGDPQTWTAAFDIPKAALSDGAQSVLLLDAETGETLGALQMLIGEALTDEALAEISLLRAELDLLKRAFRRHCTETD